VACNDDAGSGELPTLASAVQVRFVAGRVYWIALSACCSRHAPGGQGVVTLYRPRPADVSVTIESVETGDVSGRLFVNGTAACDTPSALFIDVLASQRLGDRVARGGNFGQVDNCRAGGSPWSVAIDSDTGWAFQAGTAALTTSTSGGDGFSFVSNEQTVNMPVGTNPNRTEHPRVGRSR
jgi:hypothetical protein